MQTGTLLRLAGLTLVVAIAAAVFISVRAPHGEQLKPLVFPKLSAQLEELDKIVLRGDQTTMTLSKREQHWVLDEFDGYPVLPEKVKALALGMAELRRRAPKTRDPQRYHRLGVEGAGAEDSQSVEVALWDGNTLLATLIVGNARKSRAAENKPGLYVRETDAEQSWLVEGALDVTANKTDWIERTLFDIPAEALREIHIRHAEGEQYRLYRSARGQEDFTLEPIPEGTRAAASIILNRAGSLLQNFYTNSIYHAESLPPPGETIAVRVTTFDGLVAHLTAFSHNETPYTTIRFEYLPPETPLEDETAQSETLIAMAEMLNQRMTGWVFEVPDFKYSLIRRKAVGLLKKTTLDEAMDDF